MRVTALPDCGLQVSRLSFGTARLHHLSTSARRQAILASAVDLGFTHVDTSPLYGFGIAEAEVGKFLRRSGTGLTVASKIGLYPPGGRTSSSTAVLLRKVAGKVVPGLSRAVGDWAIAAAGRSLESTLAALGRDRVDVLFLHEPRPDLLDADGFLEWLGKQKKEGKVRHWGLAGPLDSFTPWVTGGHPLSEVLQIEDAGEGGGARRLLKQGREPQFSFGGLGGRRGRGGEFLATNALKAALERNRHGSVVVESGKAAHLRELASVTGLE